MIPLIVKSITNKLAGEDIYQKIQIVDRDRSIAPGMIDPAAPANLQEDSLALKPGRSDRNTDTKAANLSTPDSENVHAAKESQWYRKVI